MCGNWFCLSDFPIVPDLPILPAFQLLKLQARTKNKLKVQGCRGIVSGNEVFGHAPPPSASFFRVHPQTRRKNY
jgi:hypothetical protein